MKKRVIGFLIGILLLFTVISGFADNGSDVYGNYEYQDLIFLSLLSSSTWDYHQEQMQHTRVTIECDLFSVADGSFRIVNPTYEKHEMDRAQMDAFKRALWMTDESVPISPDFRYVVLDADGNKAGYYLYASGSSLWVAKYVDNTNDNQDVITYIYSLEKR